MNNKLERKYGLFTAICMVVGIVIGSGVFFKAQTILQITNGDMPLGVIAWLIGGAIMLACILTFAGMSQKYEKVNGIVDYAEATVGQIADECRRRLDVLSDAVKHHEVIAGTLHFRKLQRSHFRYSFQSFFNRVTARPQVES